MVSIDEPLLLLRPVISDKAGVRGVGGEDEDVVRDWVGGLTKTSGASVVIVSTGHC